jgi:hypothetical protein
VQLGSLRAREPAQLVGIELALAPGDAPQRAIDLAPFEPRGVIRATIAATTTDIIHRSRSIEHRRLLGASSRSPPLSRRKSTSWNARSATTRHLDRFFSSSTAIVAHSAACALSRAINSRSSDPRLARSQKPSIEIARRSRARVLFSSEIASRGRSAGPRMMGARRRRRRASRLTLASP